MKQPAGSPSDPAPLRTLVASLSTDVPKDLLELARLHVFDALVAAMAGTRTPEWSRLRAEMGDREGRPAAALGWLGLGDLSTTDAASAMARLIRCTEIDDLQLRSCTTPGAIVVPAMLAAADGSAPVSAGRLLSAVVVGYEAVYRFGLAVGGADQLYRGGWPTLAVAAVGAAAAAGTTLGLDAASMAHALALALACTPAFRSRTEAARMFSFGVVVAAGVEAAVAARAGVTGDLEILEDARTAGGLVRFDPACTTAASDSEPRHEGLREAHLKHWCSAGQVAAALEAFGRIQDELGLTKDDVDRVEVEVPPAYAAMIDRPAVGDRISSMLSVQYGIALRLAHPEDLFDCVRSTLHREPDFQALMSRVNVSAAADLDPLHPSTWPARVSVTALDGRRAELVSSGRSPDPEWVWAKVLDKGRRVAEAAQLGLDVEALGEVVRNFSRARELTDALRDLGVGGNLRNPRGPPKRGPHHVDSGEGGDQINGSRRRNGVRVKVLPVVATAVRRTGS